MKSCMKTKAVRIAAQKAYIKDVKNRHAVLGNNEDEDEIEDKIEEDNSKSSNSTP